MRTFAVLFAFLACASASAAPDPERGVQVRARLDYTQSDGFWSSMTDLMGVGRSPVGLHDALDGRYGLNQEVFSKLSVGAYFPDFYLEASSEFIFWGVAQNPVLSELHGRMEGMGILALGFTNQSRTSPLRTRWALVGGKGLGRRSDVISPDLASSAPPVSESLTLAGLDLGLGLESPDEGSFRAGATIDSRAALFFSDVEGRVETLRWKTMLYMGGWDESGKGSLYIKPHLTLGPQPLPVDLLPRLWDYVHHGIDEGPLRNWAGAGVEGGYYGANDSALRGILGFYGRHWGGSLTYNPGAFELKAATWGINLGPNGAIDSERLWSFSLGVTL